MDVFQSLKGILSDLDREGNILYERLGCVSIPKRDFIGFRLHLGS